MSRPRKQAYRSSALSDLSRQLLYAPPAKRAEVVGQAEQLHDALEPSKNYPLDYVVYRLTDRRVPPAESVMLVGEAIKPDLRLLIDALSRSIELPCDADDPGMTSKELAEEVGVSTKTIVRWRDAGLRWRWGVREGKHAVLITQSALDAFEASHAGRVDRAASFMRFTEGEKASLIARARRLARATDALPQAIFRHLAKRTGRSSEAIRLLLHQHDQDNPAAPVLMNRTTSLTDREKQMIADDYGRGVTVSALSDRFGKTRSTIYRTIREARAERIKAMTLTAVYASVFERDDADEVLMAPLKRMQDSRRLGPEVLASLPVKLKAIYDRPIEPDDAVRSRIVRYNFLKHRAIQLRERIGLNTPRAFELDQFDDLIERIHRVRGETISAVLPITLSVVLRQRTTQQDDQASSLPDQLFLAHQVMLDEIDQFDSRVAHSFESVLTNRLMRLLAKPNVALASVDEDALMDQLKQAGFMLES